MRYTYKNFYNYVDRWFVDSQRDDKPVVKIVGYTFLGVFVSTRNTIYSWKEFNRHFSIVPKPKTK